MTTLLALPVKMDRKPTTCHARDILGHKQLKMPLSSNLKLGNRPFKQNKRTEWYLVKTWRTYIYENVIRVNRWPFRILT